MSPNSETRRDPAFTKSTNANGYMEGRGCREAHLRVKLHDGRTVLAGTTMDGWWANVWTDGYCDNHAEGRNLELALVRLGIDDALLDEFGDGARL